MLQRKLGMLSLFVFCTMLSNAQDDKSNSLLWEISGNGLQQPSYLFGTIHMICKKDFFLSDVAKEKFTSSKQIYLELDMDDPQLQVNMMRLMQLPAGESLKSKFGEKSSSKLDSFLNKEMSMRLAVFDRFKPMMLISLIAQRILSCTEMESYEMSFVKMASQQKKELLGLERIDDQVAVFDAIPDSAEIRSIINMIGNIDEQKVEFNRMVAFYRNQDLKALYKLMIESPEMLGSQELLLDRRNQHWIPVMESAMKKSPTFFAVGAGHLPGNNGVIELLRKQGYTVNPVKL
jgi:uncharacterized protein YbaP (TraB family)